MVTEAPEALTQWGHNIVIAGDPRKVTGSKRKSFMVDMYSFEMDGEWVGVPSYLISPSSNILVGVDLWGAPSQLHSSIGQATGHLPFNAGCLSC